MEAPVIHIAPLHEVPQVTLYRLLQLRASVFVHEQGIHSEADLDGRDELPTTRMLWCTDPTGQVLVTARLLNVGAGTVTIGRLATAPTARGHGLATALLAAAAEYARAQGARFLDMHAQAYLQSWYERLGYRAVSAEFDEGGRPHLIMSLSLLRGTA